MKDFSMALFSYFRNFISGDSEIVSVSIGQPYLHWDSIVVKWDGKTYEVEIREVKEEEGK